MEIVSSVEAGTGEGLAGTKVQGGVYVTEQWFLGAEYRFQADPSRGENNVTVRTEYQFSPHFGVQGEYGDARAGSLDAVWSREY
jgi:hypothetical protein